VYADRLGIADSPALALVGEPPCNGCAERFVRTPRSSASGVAKTYRDLAELGIAMAEFVDRHNTQWLIERHSYKTPPEAYLAARKAAAA